MRKLLLSALVLGLSAGVAVAREAPSAASQGQEAAARVGPSAKVLYVCDASPLTRRGFAREHGAAAFVTAERARVEAWTGARCISESQARKLRQTLASR